MKLIIGLGNPGSQYQHTRHNIGFTIIEHYAKDHDAAFSPKTKFKAAVAECMAGDEKVLIVKPTTYYNLSGEAVRAMADFYTLHPEDILIIHDELALPIGQVRTRRGGGDAGNNGIKSINTHVGSGTCRIRIGTRGDTYVQTSDTDYVLGVFTRDEQHCLDELTPTIFHLIDSFIRDEFTHETHTANPA